MTTFLHDSGYERTSQVRVLTDGAKDLAGVASALPHDSRWILDWAHIGRLLRYVDQAIGPLAYGRLTPTGSAFELWDLFVRFRSFVWTGKTKRWQTAGDRLFELARNVIASWAGALEPRVASSWMCSATSRPTSLVDRLSELAASGSTNLNRLR